MELVGRVIELKHSRGECEFLFRCTNKEEFTICTASSNLPVKELLRIWTYRPDDKESRPQKRNVLFKWKRLDSDEEINVIGREKKQKVFTWVKDKADEEV